MESRDEAEYYIKVNYKLEFQGKAKTDNFKRASVEAVEREKMFNIIEKAWNRREWGKQNEIVSRF